MSLSPSATTKLLDSLDHRPKKKLGQNFLVDGNIVRKSLSMAELPPEIPVVEIGPGLGTLTKELLLRGHPVYAVEIDKTLYSNLENKLSDFISDKKLHLTRGDAVKNPTGNLTDEIDDFAVVSNLPYAISSAWLESLLNQQKIPLCMVLMLQKEAMERMNAEHSSKSYNALTIFLRGVFRYEKVHPVSRQCFFPVPGIDSVLVKMTRLAKPFLYCKEDRSLIRKIFTQRRKQIGTLAKRENEPVCKRLNLWMKENQIAPNLRPEQINPRLWQNISTIKT